MTISDRPPLFCWLAPLQEGTACPKLGGEGHLSAASLHAAAEGDGNDETRVRRRSDGKGREP